MIFIVFGVVPDTAIKYPPETVTLVYYFAFLCKECIVGKSAYPIDDFVSIFYAKEVVLESFFEATLWVACICIRKIVVPRLTPEVELAVIS